MATLEALAQLIIERLETIPHLTVFDGKVGAVVKDGNAVRPYAVLYLAPGSLARRGISGRSETHRVTGQITAAAGTPTGYRYAVSRVLDALTDHRLEPANLGASMFTFDGDPGPARRDEDDPSDIRWYVPLPFTVTTTRS
jgi:hypothetical protein